MIEATRTTVPPPSRWRAPAIQLGVGGLVLLASLIALGKIAEDVREQEANVLDSVLDPALHRLASPALDAFMTTMTLLGSMPILPILFVVAVGLLVRERLMREATLLVVALGGSVAINQLLKLVFHRPRPQLAWASTNPEYSFPSGHAQNSLVFYLGLALIVWMVWGRRRGIVAVAGAVVLALLIGISRLYLGMHYFTDVVGGYFAGLSWLLIVLTALHTWPLLGEWRSTRRDTTRAAARDPLPPER